jgi:hypothetical protein
MNEINPVAEVLEATVGSATRWLRSSKPPLAAPLREPQAPLSAVMRNPVAEVLEATVGSAFESLRRRCQP